MAIKGGFLRMTMVAAYFIAFCCATIITGAFAWFTVRRHFGARNIASLVIGSMTMFYTLVCMGITCFTAGVSFFAYASIVLDIVYIALMIAVAAMNGSARNGCSGGEPYARVVYNGSGSTGCRLFQASWAVAIIAILCFLVTAITQFVIRRRGRTHVDRVHRGTSRV